MTPPITSTDGIKGFYDDPQVVEKYIEKRIIHPLGSVLHELQLAFLRRTVSRFPITRVLDLASGPGRLSAEFKAPGLSVAIDFSLNMLKEARQRTVATGNNWHLLQGDGFVLPFAPENFDFIYSTRFVRRFDRARRDVLYREIRRVLRPNGFFVMDAQNRAVSLPHRKAQGLEKYPVYDELFLRDELINELEENGFRVIQIEGLMRRFPLQFRCNRLRRLRLSALARLLIRALEHTHDRNPSTWMVLCQKSKA